MARRFDQPATGSPAVTLLATLALWFPSSTSATCSTNYDRMFSFLQLTFDADRYWAILQAWGDDGLRAYRAHFRTDFAHLFIYAVWRVLATRAASRRTKRGPPAAAPGCCRWRRFSIWPENPVAPICWPVWRGAGRRGAAVGPAVGGQMGGWPRCFAAIGARVAVNVPESGVRHSEAVGWVV